MAAELANKERDCFVYPQPPSSSSTFLFPLLPQRAVSTAIHHPSSSKSSSMPLRTRATLAVPIKPKHFWRMHCLRTSLKQFDSSADEPFEIDCILDAKASVACRQCSSRNSTCNPVRFANTSWGSQTNLSQAATAMLGDAHDLAAVLS